jgi:hypothetical protein
VPGPSNGHPHEKTNPQNPSPQGSNPTLPAPHPSNFAMTTTNNNNKVMIKLNHPSRYCTYTHSSFSFPSLLPRPPPSQPPSLFFFTLFFLFLTYLCGNIRPELRGWFVLFFSFFLLFLRVEVRQATQGLVHQLIPLLVWSGLVWALP